MGAESELLREAPVKVEHRQTGDVAQGLAVEFALDVPFDVGEHTAKIVHASDVAISVRPSHPEAPTVAPMSYGFVRWEMRTIDVDLARSFYEDLLEEGVSDVTELPEAARLNGAKPHWLGHLSVHDTATSLEALVARGAKRLGAGLSFRDSSGAVLALTSLQLPSRRDVVWQQLLTSDPVRAKKDYVELFGMSVRTRVEVPTHGAFDQFAWANGPPTGSVGDINGKPHIHPQWLFFFRVAELDLATSRVEKRGGLVVGRTMLPDGRLVAVCDDSQGAAFGLMQNAK